MSPAFHFKLLVGFSFVTSVIATSGSCNVTQPSRTVFNGCSGGEKVEGALSEAHSKDEPGGFQGFPGMLQTGRRVRWVLGQL